MYFLRGFTRGLCMKAPGILLPCAEEWCMWHWLLDIEINLVGEWTYSPSSHRKTSNLTSVIAPIKAWSIVGSKSENCDRIFWWINKVAFFYPLITSIFLLPCWKWSILLFLKQRNIKLWFLFMNPLSSSPRQKDSLEHNALSFLASVKWYPSSLSWESW